MTTILGISAFYHDSAAAIIVDGEIVAAAQEERFTRQKHDASFPKHAIQYCLDHVGISAADLDHVAFYEKPFKKFERLLETHLKFAPFGLRSFCDSIPVWLRSKLYISRAIRKGLPAYRKRIIFPEHHESHAASAFFPSPFEDAAILTADGAGEWATTTLGVGRANKIELNHEIEFPDSLGLLYSAFTYFCGFRVNGGEGKLMGLAPFGEPVYAEKILENIVDLKLDGSFRLDQRFFNYCTGATMTSDRFSRLFGGPARIPESNITQRERDLASSIQSVTETILLRIANHLHATTGMKDLCLAGGVALNCVANGRLQRESPFENVWIQPAAGDSGGAIGAALFVWHQLLGKQRVPNQFSSMFLGPPAEANSAADFGDAAVSQEFGSSKLLASEVAQLLQAGLTVGWVQGRMEFGPRALGNRSILASPLLGDMPDRLNRRVKFREPFRPFAPIVIAEKCPEYFEDTLESPYMLVADQVRTSAGIPAVTHVDGSARIQTVAASQNPEIHELLLAFESLTGCPLLVNTSFNVRGEPIVCCVDDALDCFFKTDLDVLVIGRFMLKKSDQKAGYSPPSIAKQDSASLFEKVKLSLHKVTAPIRWGVSYLVLTLVYIMLITPIGFMMRMVKWPSRAEFKTDGDSYWQKRKTKQPASSYFKQY